MRKFNQGACTRVTVSCDEIERWADNWPCSGFCYGDRASFTFERNGDLVDLRISNTYGDDVSERPDGEAVAALADDAKRYAGLAV